ncbi:DNA gyrase subunit A, partial [Salmonella enterica]
RTEFDLIKAKKRAHIVEGIIKAIQGIDTVIDIIRNAEDPILELQETINVSEEQSKAITEMKLISLSKLETTKLTDELKDLNVK